MYYRGVSTYRKKELSQLENKTEQSLQASLTQLAMKDI